MGGLPDESTQKGRPSSGPPSPIHKPGTKIFSASAYHSPDLCPSLSRGVYLLQNNTFHFIRPRFTFADSHTLPGLPFTRREIRMP